MSTIPYLNPCGLEGSQCECTEKIIEKVIIPDRPKYPCPPPPCPPANCMPKSCCCDTKDMNLRIAEANVNASKANLTSQAAKITADSATLLALNAQLTANEALSKGDITAETLAQINQNTLDIEALQNAQEDVSGKVDKRGVYQENITLIDRVVNHIDDLLFIRLSNGNSSELVSEILVLPTKIESYSPFIALFARRATEEPDPFGILLTTELGGKIEIGTGYNNLTEDGTAQLTFDGADVQLINKEGFTNFACKTFSVTGSRDCLLNGNTFVALMGGQQIINYTPHFSVHTDSSNSENPNLEITRTNNLDSIQLRGYRFASNTDKVYLQANDIALSTVDRLSNGSKIEMDSDELNIYGPLVNIGRNDELSVGTGVDTTLQASIDLSTRNGGNIIIEADRSITIQNRARAAEFGHDHGVTIKGSGIILTGANYDLSSCSIGLNLGADINNIGVAGGISFNFPDGSAIAYKPDGTITGNYNINMLELYFTEHLLRGGLGIHSDDDYKQLTIYLPFDVNQSVSSNDIEGIIPLDNIPAKCFMGITSGFTHFRIYKSSNNIYFVMLNDEPLIVDEITIGSRTLRNSITFTHNATT